MKKPNSLLQAATHLKPQSAPFKILILGGYGAFGKKIASELFKHNHHSTGSANEIIIAGRNLQSALQFKDQLQSLSDKKTNNVHATSVDANSVKSLRECLESSQPDLVINTCGPFQGQNYHVAEECIEKMVNYVDLSDSREFLRNFSKELNDKAVKNNVLAVCGGWYYLIFQ